MSKRLLSGCAAAMAALLLATGAQAGTVSSFDAGWLFAKGDAAGADAAAFNDAQWTKVNLPNDWAIAGPFDAKAATTGSGAWLPSGVAWYRKHFTVPAADAGKRVFIEFDGVMDLSKVWINGQQLGYRPNGYSSFRYELTPYLKAGDNVISVRADTSAQPASRWYAGGGIYRHVKLITSGDVHFDTNGNYVTTPKVDAANASVHVESTVVNQAKADRAAHIEVAILGPEGKTITTTKGGVMTIAAGQSARLSADTALVKPHLWNMDDPALHKAVIKVVADNGEVLDQDTVTFGVRDAHFDAATGFWLNGKNIKLKGTAIHADGGAFGMAVPVSVYERRIRDLKALGVNAIRTAHHPFTPEFLEACDRMGIVVMAEAFDMWEVGKNPYDYHLYFDEWSSKDLKDFVDRDRNHPSIVIWSIGNEIHDTPNPDKAKPILTRLRDVVHAEDTSRPVTQALFRPNVSHDYDDGLADLLDVVGQNYRENELTKAHADNPNRKIIGTENTKDRGPWVSVRDNPAYAGMFLWTGIDYLGEADRAGWPFISNPSGLMDRDDVVKAIGWERASWWSEKPVVKLARRTVAVKDNAELVGNELNGINQAARRQDAGAYADWTPAKLDAHAEKVEVYSNAPTAELFLNGKSLGKLPRNADDSPRVWDVTFAPGTIKAVGYDAAGKVLGEDTQQTAGAPAVVRLTSETKALAPGFENIGFVRAEVVDAKGVVVPSAAVPLTIKIGGSGSLAAADNGSPQNHTAFTSPTRDTWQGNALIMVRADKPAGAITVSASAPGLKAGTATITAKP
jgi:beta-galactosidase